MMPRSLDLGLGLGLGLASQRSLSSSTSSPASPWSAALNSIVGAAGVAEDQGRTSTSPDSASALSSASGKRELERTGSGAAVGSDDEDGAGGRKKLRLSKDQAAVLEECFKTHSTLNPKQKVALANRLGLRPRQVEVWFQNRRARTKLKQTEVDCEYLKRWCERLADENKRLEKELADLRALKAAPAPSPASALQPSCGAAPVATLTMCPSCRRVANAGAPPPNQQWHPKSNIPTATAPAVAGNVLPSHCQFFPTAADRTSQSTWNAAAPLVTRELF